MSRPLPLGWGGGTEVDSSFPLLWPLGLQPLEEEAKESGGQEPLLQQGSVVAPVGEFLWFLRGELNSPLCLIIKEVNEQCIGWGPVTIWASTGICKDASQTDALCTQHQIQDYLHRAPQPVDPPFTQLCCSEFAPELGSLSTLIPGRLQDKAETVSYPITEGNFTP